MASIGIFICDEGNPFTELIFHTETDSVYAWTDVSEGGESYYYVDIKSVVSPPNGKYSVVVARKARDEVGFEYYVYTLMPIATLVYHKDKQCIHIEAESFFTPMLYEKWQAEYVKVVEIRTTGKYRFQDTVLMLQSGAAYTKK